MQNAFAFQRDVTQTQDLNLEYTNASGKYTDQKLENGSKAVVWGRRAAERGRRADVQKAKGRKVSGEHGRMK
eukprot:685773-Pleurochrysis_carterae.AAC.1